MTQVQKLNGHLSKEYAKPYRPHSREARFIGSVVIQARQYVSKIVVVGDGSTDETALIARQAGAEVLELRQNGGKARALSLGIDYIRRLKPTAVLMLDGDGQHSPNQIPHLLAPNWHRGKCRLLYQPTLKGRTSHQRSGICDELSLLRSNRGL